MKHILLILALMAQPVPALAHKVIVGVFAAGEAIEGELGFSNGDMAAGQEVVVYGPEGQELGRTVTDTDGFFLFTPTQPIAHRFKANLGAGHVADVTMPADDVATILGMTPGVAVPAAVPQAESATLRTALSDAERAAIAAAVRDEIRPLRREIAAYREKNDLQTILGGIGYVLGLFGIGFYIAARKKLSA
ncbi:cobalt ABC transporter permease [Cognatishimia sp. SS12]|uniref:cobalt ABC transporter permease n=1 Tax=Cognatishimia sp. SS12 TaxID=2979465 RepID=UPI00232CFDE7|nr:cobalt ABC transporter permease [Cognatishimia sp. SS12]MDC0738285.1 cobalt ABC transporter permease [Cognatishimia sp. SS12]